MPTRFGAEARDFTGSIENFGPLDKGAGISEPDREPTDIPIPVEPELVGAAAGATVAEAQPLVEPAAGPSAEAVPAKRRWWKRLGVRAPRPSGT